ncbi:MAG: alanine--glyoxylate aminotransferase family protein [Coriobacteriia bacterium]|nr:alanine--glyoxylate aminotransferase family protein [Coriobacteriia bacterium]MCL2606282.1 alanine--glyoxylate aminotransferase family protein [Coriobacteriia bacterium]
MSLPKRYLMTPGPTPVPADVLLTMARPIIHHRTAEFEATVAEAVRGLQYIFNTKNDVLMLASSGTGAMESAIVNCFSAGDKVIIARNGKFGDREKSIAKAYGLEVIDLCYEWNQVVSVSDVADALAANPDARGVIVTQSETSTGVLNPIKEIAACVRDLSDTVMIVDSITGIGAMECETDDWGLDVVMTGSQKGLMLPPGLAAVSVSEKAWRAAERSTLPKFYFDWKKYRKSLEKDTTPFTPALTLIQGLSEALKLMQEEGRENIIARHNLLAKATREGVEAIGLQLFAPPEGRGSAVTPVWSPEGIPAGKIVKIMKEDYGVTITNGQDDYKDRIFRIGHLGYFGPFDIITALTALEMALTRLGYNFEQGASIKAAESVFLNAH